MRTAFRLILLLFIVGLVVIQFFQPEKNQGTVGANHLLTSEQVPDDISQLLTNACLDCHSNQTDYLWYHQFAPVSWFINDHIVEGKSELNLSNWKTLEVLDQIAALEDIAKEVDHGKMPLKSYAAVHSKARLSEEETKALVAWANDFSERLLTGE
ncbi:heme-binding domain-containing protein [Sunxiuqinia sp. sy24]|uniref:heme-binding domain-containing protein n=1 Tax=Sunxiuqinia sp. sy24 TaxID=3461495 RepID=UPI0040451F11